MSTEAEKQIVLGKFEHRYREIESKLRALSPAQLPRSVWTEEGELDRAHSAFMDALRALPPSRFVKADGEPFRYFWTPGAGHLQLHWEHIEAALKETSTT